jgi:hypothetical protein
VKNKETKLQKSLQGNLFVSLNGLKEDLVQRFESSGVQVQRFGSTECIEKINNFVCLRCEFSENFAVGPEAVFFFFILCLQ